METTVTPEQTFLPEKPRVAVVVNRFSTGAAHADEQIRILIENGYCTEQDVYETVRGDNREGLQRHFLRGAYQPDNDETTTGRVPYDAAVVLSGDGILNQVVNAVVGDESPPEDTGHKELPDDVRDIVIIAGKNGGASDGHHSLFNDDLDLANLGSLPVVNISPMEVTTTSHATGETKTHRTILYGDVGAIALGIDDVNQPEHRSTPVWWRRLVREPKIAIWALARTVPFILEENGVKRKVYDVLFCNVPRMARVGGMPGDPREKTFAYREATSRVGLVKALGHLAFNAATDKKLGWETDQQERTFTVKPRRYGRGKHKPIPIQISGDTHWLNGATTVTMKKATRWVRMASTCLATA